MYQDQREKTQLLDQLKLSWKALTVIAGLFAAGFTTAIFILGFVGIPEVVKDNSERIGILEESQRTIVAQIQMSNCLSIAEREEFDWRRCKDRDMRNELMRMP